MAEALGLRQLAKEHCDKLIPTRKALRLILGFQIVHMPSEIMAIEQGKKLAKQAASTYIFHRVSPNG